MKLETLLDTYREVAEDRCLLLDTGLSLMPMSSRVSQSFLEMLRTAAHESSKHAPRREVLNAGSFVCRDEKFCSSKPAGVPKFPQAPHHGST
jgi:hypothetical protein